MPLRFLRIMVNDLKGISLLREGVANGKLDLRKH
jgi:hypothetical protein